MKRIVLDCLVLVFVTLIFDRIKPAPWLELLGNSIVAGTFSMSSMITSCPFCLHFAPSSFLLVLVLVKTFTKSVYDNSSLTNSSRPDAVILFSIDNECSIHCAGTSFTVSSQVSIARLSVNVGFRKHQRWDSGGAGGIMLGAVDVGEEWSGTYIGYSDIFWWFNCTKTQIRTPGFCFKILAFRYHSVTVTEVAIILVEVGRPQVRSRRLSQLQTRPGGPGLSRHRSMATPGSSDVGHWPGVRQEARGLP